MIKPAKPTKSVELPKFGDRIRADHFHVSTMNIRYNESFGESEADKILVENMRRGNIVEPFLARPEGEGFGVYAGRRKLLSKKMVGMKAFVVGQDCLIRNLTDEQAREESLIEDLDVLREELNPMVRARALQNLIDSSNIGLRGVARKLGISPGQLSEYTRILDLTKPMQEAVEKGEIAFREALKLVRLKAGEMEEERLAKVASELGKEAYSAELQKLNDGSRRGVPRGKYDVLRLNFNRSSEGDIHDKLVQLAKAKNMEPAEYSKQVLVEHVKSLM